MKKISLLIAIVGIGWSCLSFAQDSFWNFDDNQNPLPIPAECDAKFDEIRGGVFMPTVDEMYEYGMSFLKNSAISVQQQGAYCLLGAALQGHPDAQLEMAKLYEDGTVLPQDDLSAYKWAFIAALNGNKPAEKLTLIIEQFLTTSDLEKTSGAIQETRMQIQQNLQKKMEEEKQQAEEDQHKLEEMQSEINQKYNKKAIPVNNNVEAAPMEGPSPEKLQENNNNLNAIFSESDRME